jgi:hypothetical protein
MPSFMIAKVRSGKKPFTVTVVHDLPVDPVAFHGFMKDMVCKRNGYGMYAIARSHREGEKRGWKGVWLGTIQPEGVTTFRTYPNHPVFPGEFKKMWFEKGDIRRIIRIPQFEDSITRVVASFLADTRFGAQKPKRLRVKKGVIGLVKACLKS